MRFKGTTFDDKSNIVNVYECEVCGNIQRHLKLRDNDTCRKCGLVNSSSLRACDMKGGIEKY